MSPENPNLNLVFIKGGHALGEELREEILKREPGTLVQFTLPESNEKSDPALETELSGILLNHPGVFKVVLFGFAYDEPVPFRILLILASRSILAVERLEIADGLICFHDHRPMEEKKSRVLMVFPGAIIPVVMGSHRRAFQLAANLAAQGCPLDLLITGGSDKLICGAKPLLYQIAGRVTHFANRRPRLTRRLLWRKRLERSIRVINGTFPPPPDLFEERLNVAASYSGCKALRSVLEGGHYRSVIINYAWLANIRKLLLPGELRNISWICDTHDVQFIRNQTDNHKERRFFRCSEREKQCELEVLRTFDKVLAISEPDAVSLQAELGADKVIFTPTGFDYALGEPSPPNPEALVFGFIGRLMRANEKALREIIVEWWPAILHRWPRATLRIAGGICQSGLLSENARLPAGVVLDHFIPDLSTWYRSIDIMANPVMVQGGMNFKSMEALMAAKLLLTNRMGLACLSNPEFAAAAETGAEVVAALERAISSPQSYLEDRLRIRDEARKIFGDAHANHGLLSYLRNSANQEPAVPVVDRPQRILIQCGDHLENRIRVTALARGLRERGHHPIVLVYKEEFVAPFLSLGVDAVAIEQFESGPREQLERIALSYKIRKLTRTYKGYDLDDVSGMLQMQKPESLESKTRRHAVQRMLHHVDRCAAMLEHVRPDQIVIWNGHTGWVANILRHHARLHAMPKYLLERSVFPDGVFIDPLGTNGNSELSRLDSRDLEALQTHSASRSLQTFQATVPTERIRSLRTSGPWKDARKIIFIPLQVQSDTNILLYSPHYRNMADFISGVHRTYHAPGVAFIVRPHPEEVDTDLQLPVLPDVHLDSASSLDEWISAADVVVTINSTVGMQALFKNKPVRAFGRGIYTGKGFTHEVVPGPEQLGRFWNVLVNRYTSTPDQPFPECLERTLPAMEKQAYQPVNRYGRHPDQCLLIAEEFKARVRESASRGGRLHVVVGAPEEKGTLDLNYRQTRQPFSEAGLAKCVRQSLDLPPEVEILCVESCPPDAPHVAIRSWDTDSRAPFMDKYGWVVAPAEQAPPA